MAGRRWIGAGMLLGALVFGVAGATAGSWVGGISPGPLPSNAEALRLAGEILPGVAPVEEIDRRDYVYGSRLGDEESGPGYVEITYEVGDECAYDAVARANAIAHGWTDFSDATWYHCPEWYARHDDLVLSYTHAGTGRVLTFYRATDGPTAGALIGGVLGVAGGAVTARALSRRRPVATVLALGVPAVVAGPAAGFIVLLLTLGSRSGGPFPQLWTVWASLWRLFFRYW